MTAHDLDPKGYLPLLRALLRKVAPGAFRARPRNNVACCA